MAAVLAVFLLIILYGVPIMLPVYGFILLIRSIHSWKTFGKSDKILIFVSFFLTLLYIYTISGVVYTANKSRQGYNLVLPDPVSTSPL